MVHVSRDVKHILPIVLSKCLNAQTNVVRALSGIERGVFIIV